MTKTTVLLHREKTAKRGRLVLRRSYAINARKFQNKPHRFLPTACLCLKSLRTSAAAASSSAKPRRTDRRTDRQPDTPPRLTTLPLPAIFMPPAVMAAPPGAYSAHGAPRRGRAPGLAGSIFSARCQSEPRPGEGGAP